MNEERKFGLIFAADEIARCKRLGIKSDVERVIDVAAPWDAKDQPEITTWEEFRPYAEKRGEVMNRLRLSRSTYIFDYLNHKEIDADALFLTTQQQNDCTAWAASRCYLSMVLHQIIRGAEQTVDTLNPMAIYSASSGYDLKPGDRIPNGGRTIYAIAEASCIAGNYPAAFAGEYNGRCVYTSQMEAAQKEARKRQMGWALFDNTNNSNAVCDAVFTACKAGFPVIFGNSIAVQDGYDIDENGVSLARVNGSGWGGGHAQSWIDYQCVNGKEYVLYANSHGNRYNNRDARLPGWAVWMTRDIVKRMVSSYFDMLIGTWAEAPKSEPIIDLNLGGIND